MDQVPLWTTLDGQQSPSCARRQYVRHAECAIYRMLAASTSDRCADLRDSCPWRHRSRWSVRPGDGQPGPVRVSEETGTRALRGASILSGIASQKPSGGESGSLSGDESWGRRARRPDQQSARAILSVSWNIIVPAPVTVCGAPPAVRQYAEKASPLRPPSGDCLASLVRQLTT